MRSWYLLTSTRFKQQLVRAVPAADEAQRQVKAGSVAKLKN
jgi:hypothetical protein